MVHLIFLARHEVQDRCTAAVCSLILLGFEEVKVTSVGMMIRLRPQEPVRSRGKIQRTVPVLPMTVDSTIKTTQGGVYQVCLFIPMLWCCGALLMLKGTSSPRVSWFPEIANNWPGSPPMVCKPTNPKPTPQLLLYGTLRRLYTQSQTIASNEVQDNYALLEPSYGKNQVNFLAQPIFKTCSITFLCGQWCLFLECSSLCLPSDYHLPIPQGLLFL